MGAEGVLDERIHAAGPAFEHLEGGQFARAARSIERYPTNGGRATRREAAAIVNARHDAPSVHKLDFSERGQLGWQQSLQCGASLHGHRVYHARTRTDFK